MKEKEATCAESQSKNTPVEHFAPFWTEKNDSLILGNFRQNGQKSKFFYLKKGKKSSRTNSLLGAVQSLIL